MATSKKVTFGVKPAPKIITQDAWVDDRVLEGEVKTKRLTLDIPAKLHGQIKSACALRGVNMVDEIRELLEKKYGS